MTKDQHIILHPTAEDLTCGRIMQDAHGEGTLRFMKLRCEKRFLKHSLQVPRNIGKTQIGLSWLHQGALWHCESPGA
jgi:hypothetical protein